MDQFNLVAVRILKEGQHRGPSGLHRTGLPNHLAPLGLDRRTGGVHILDTKGDVAVGITEVIGVGIPVVGQLQNGVVALGAEPDKSQGETTVGVVPAPQQGHAKHVGIEGQRALQISDPKHGVQHPHGRRSALVITPTFWPGVVDDNRGAQGDP